MATRAVSRPLAQLPNALTVARLLLIPVFVVLIAEADGGYSWTAGSLGAGTSSRRSERSPTRSPTGS
jgi:phosphatidylglycerophosphate synthase